MIIRKQEKDITVNDLMQFPAWEYALDEETVEGQNEKTLRPYLKLPPLDPNLSYFIVKTSFTLANGITLVGYIEPRTIKASKLSIQLIPYDLHPVILTKKGNVHFCCGQNKPDDEKISRKYKLLGMGSDKVFPIKFKADIDIINGFSQGDLMGFMFISESATNFFKLQPSDVLYVR